MSIIKKVAEYSQLHYAWSIKNSGLGVVAASPLQMRDEIEKSCERLPGANGGDPSFYFDYSEKSSAYLLACVQVADNKESSRQSDYRHIYVYDGRGEANNIFDTAPEAYLGRHIFTNKLDNKNAYNSSIVEYPYSFESDLTNAVGKWIKLSGLENERLLSILLDKTMNAAFKSGGAGAAGLHIITDSPYAAFLKVLDITTTLHRALPDQLRKHITFSCCPQSKEALKAMRYTLNFTYEIQHGCQTEVIYGDYVSKDSSLSRFLSKFYASIILNNGENLEKVRDSLGIIVFDLFKEYGLAEYPPFVFFAHRNYIQQLNSTQMFEACSWLLRELSLENNNFYDNEITMDAFRMYSNFLDVDQLKELVDTGLKKSASPKRITQIKWFLLALLSSDISYLDHILQQRSKIAQESQSVLDEILNPMIKRKPVPFNEILFLPQLQQYYHDETYEYDEQGYIKKCIHLFESGCAKENYLITFIRNKPFSSPIYEYLIQRQAENLSMKDHQYSSLENKYVVLQNDNNASSEKVLQLNAALQKINDYTDVKVEEVKKQLEAHYNEREEERQQSHDRDIAALKHEYRRELAEANDRYELMLREKDDESKEPKNSKKRHLPDIGGPEKELHVEHKQSDAELLLAYNKAGQFNSTPAPVGFELLQKNQLEKDPNFTLKNPGEPEDELEEKNRMNKELTITNENLKSRSSVLSWIYVGLTILFIALCIGQCRKSTTPSDEIRQLTSINTRLEEANKALERQLNDKEAWSIDLEKQLNDEKVVRAHLEKQLLGVNDDAADPIFSIGWIPGSLSSDTSSNKAPSSVTDPETDSKKDKPTGATADDQQTTTGSIGTSTTGASPPTTATMLEPVTSTSATEIYSGYPRFPGTLKSGSSGDVVRFIQTMLYELRDQYADDRYDRSTFIDGHYGGATKDAVEKLQDNVNPPVIGEIDKRTWDILIEVYDQVPGVKDSKTLYAEIVSRNNLS